MSYVWAGIQSWFCIGSLKLANKNTAKSVLKTKRQFASWQNGSQPLEASSCPDYTSIFTHLLKWCLIQSNYCLLRQKWGIPKMHEKSNANQNKLVCKNCCANMANNYVILGAIFLLSKLSELGFLIITI